MPIPAVCGWLPTPSRPAVKPCICLQPAIQCLQPSLSSTNNFSLYYCCWFAPGVNNRMELWPQNRISLTIHHQTIYQWIRIGICRIPPSPKMAAILSVYPYVIITEIITKYYRMLQLSRVGWCGM